MREQGAQVVSPKTSTVIQVTGSAIVVERKLSCLRTSRRSLIVTNRATRPSFGF